MTARYQLLEHLGTTADSTLYRARHRDSGKPAMLKRVDPANVGVVTLAHFRDEYALLQSLDIAGLIKPAALINEGENLAMTLDTLDDFAQLAACLGNKFDLRHLVLVGGLAEDEAWQRLSAAVREDFFPSSWWCL